MFETCFYQNYALNLNKIVPRVSICRFVECGFAPVRAMSELLSWEGGFESGS